MPSDVEGVGNLKAASLLGVIVQTMFWVGFLIFYLIYNAATSVVSTTGTAGATTLPTWITVNTVYLAAGLLAGGLVIGIIVYIFFFLGFRSIKRGAPDFGAPTALMIIGLIGFLMMAAGVGLIIAALAAVISNPGGNAGFGLGAILGGFALIGLGGLLGFIGVVGIVLGNWRAGGRYNESSIKIGSILAILPFVSIVGYILLLVGYSKTSSKLRSGWAPAAMGMMMGAPMAAPGMMPPAAPAAAPPACPTCGQPATWVAQYSRWYCTRDQKYL